MSIVIIAIIVIITSETQRISLNNHKITTVIEIHSNLSYPGSAGPEDARMSEFARISEKL